MTVMASWRETLIVIGLASIVIFIIFTVNYFRQSKCDHLFAYSSISCKKCGKEYEE